MMSSRGKAGGAVSFLKAIFVDWALAQNAFIFETTAHCVAAYYVSTDPLSLHCSYRLKSASQVSRPDCSILGGSGDSGSSRTRQIFHYLGG